MSNPDKAMCRAALDITQRAAEECLFIDDRPAKLEPAKRLGMQTILYQNPDQCRLELAQHGVPLGNRANGAGSV